MQFQDISLQSPSSSHLDDVIAGVVSDAVAYADNQNLRQPSPKNISKEAPSAREIAQSSSNIHSFSISLTSITNQANKSSRPSISLLSNDVASTLVDPLVLESSLFDSTNTSLYQSAPRTSLAASFIPSVQPFQLSSSDLLSSGETNKAVEGTMLLDCSAGRRDRKSSGSRLLIVESLRSHTTHSSPCSSQLSSSFLPGRESNLCSSISSISNHTLSNIATCSVSESVRSDSLPIPETSSFYNQLGATDLKDSSKRDSPVIMTPSSSFTSSSFSSSSPISAPTIAISAISTSPSSSSSSSSHSSSSSSPASPVALSILSYGVQQPASDLIPFVTQTCTTVSRPDAMSLEASDAVFWSRQETASHSPTLLETTVCNDQRDESSECASFFTGCILLILHIICPLM
ncbi:unnamed protein product [Protopolystoma xenopodis]|uniref:Uncharacterized protein n=1 Tax=Protopolystoma xenopodis TaxID=117903 RepID=A0A3S5BQF2_9PLAT|nr:unnamed protein product [Protopolystoma xenopodis]